MSRVSCLFKRKMSDCISHCIISSKKENHITRKTTTDVEKRLAEVRTDS